MKKIVQYLYEYQNGKRIQNVGFVKGEIRTKDATFQIYGKGFPIDKNQMLEIWMFYQEGEKCVGVSMGTISSQSPMFGYRLDYDIQDLGGQQIFDQIAGMAISSEQNGTKKWYAAVWNGDQVNVETLIPQAELVPAEEIVAEETVAEEVVPEEETIAVEAEVVPEKETIAEESEEVPVEEAPSEEVVLQEERKKDLIYKITREELVGLPRCEWKLANNQFLLHGYYNYHHLVSFEKDGACWIGVPGVFHPQEQKAAFSFGFDQFMKPDEGEIELEEDQMEAEEDFGYWCRKVSNVVKNETGEIHAKEIDN